MDLTAIPKFDPDPFTAAELKKLAALADRCEAATTPTQIEAAGAALDGWRQQVRDRAQQERSRAQSRNALFKRLAHEVPRRHGKAVKREE